ncbi:hypothetical protein [Microbacterium sp. NPDC056052]|uniref:hypothetical protein n=1 Tax=Microbacterium sp. NPDC056052 TaxID=3345695 RepID=UPI0035D73DF7
MKTTVQTSPSASTGAVAPSLFPVPVLAVSDPQPAYRFTATDLYQLATGSDVTSWPSRDGSLSWTPNGPAPSIEIVDGHEALTLNSGEFFNFLTIPGLSTSDFTVIVYAKITTPSSGNGTIIATGSQQWRISTTRTLNTSGFSGGSLGAPLMPTGWDVVAFSLQYAAIGATRNARLTAGGDVSSATNVTSASAHPGNVSLGYGGGGGAVMSVREAHIHKAYLTDAQIAARRAELKTYWG